MADSLISSLGGTVDEAVSASWEGEIRKGIAELDSGAATMVPWEEVLRRNLAKIPYAP